MKEKETEKKHMNETREKMKILTERKSEGSVWVCVCVREGGRGRERDRETKEYEERKRLKRKYAKRENL